MFLSLTLVENYLQEETAEYFLERKILIVFLSSNHVDILYEKY